MNDCGTGFGIWVDAPESLKSWNPSRTFRIIERWIEQKGTLALTFRSEDGTTEIDLLVGEADQF